MKNDMVKFLCTLPVSVSEDPIVLGTFRGYRLAAPKSFWDCPEDTRAEITNGCGPKGFGDLLVPDSVYGLSITPACAIHDWMFTVFNCEKGFALANQVFFDNMSRINTVSSRNALIKWLRMLRICKYHSAVSTFGRLFYYDAHNDLYSEIQGTSQTLYT